MGVEISGLGNSYGRVVTKLLLKPLYLVRLIFWREHLLVNLRSIRRIGWMGDQIELRAINLVWPSVTKPTMRGIEEVRRVLGEIGCRKNADRRCNVQENLSDIINNAVAITNNSQVAATKARF